jgi:hypothetical protein
MLKFATELWDERRRAGQRLHVNLLDSVAIAVEDGTFGFLAWRPQFLGSIQDMSVSGCQIVSEHALSVHSVVRLWVNVQLRGNVIPLKLRGDVVWSAPLGTTGKCRVGIRLRPKPQEYMQLWSNSVMEKMRSFWGADTLHSKIHDNVLVTH